MNTMTQNQLAELVGKTSRRIRMIDSELPEEKRMYVRAEDGRYDAALFVQRWCAYQVDKAIKASESFGAVKARHEMVKTEKTTLEVMKLRGELVSVRDVQRLWGNIAQTVMQAMLQLPATVSPMVQGMTNVQAIHAVLDKEIRHALTQLSETPLPETEDVLTDEDETDEAEDAEEDSE